MLAFLALPLLLCSVESVAADEVTFASYNIENYLRMDRGQGGRDLPKPEKEIAALLAIIRENDPDILGVCEIGGRPMFEDLLRRLGKTHAGAEQRKHWNCLETS